MTGLTGHDLDDPQRIAATGPEEWYVTVTILLVP